MSAPGNILSGLIVSALPMARRLYRGILRPGIGADAGAATSS
jgi:hypothetical protein